MHRLYHLSMNRFLFVLAVVTVFGLASPSTGQIFRPQNPFPQRPVYRNGQPWNPAQPNPYQPRPAYPNGPPWQPSQPNSNQQQPQQKKKVKPGTTTRVMPDGRIITVAPFSEELKRQVAEREAIRARLKKVRERELDQQGENESLYPRLPAEFEKQKAILLSLADWQAHHLSVLVELIEETRGRTYLLILHNDKNLYDEKPQLNDLLELLEKSGNDYSHLRFLNVNLDSIWLRDFGPRIAQTEVGGSMVMDFFYDTIRPLDDEFPKVWADSTSASYNVVPWVLQGGNLLSNGRGLAIATSRIYEDNRLFNPDKTVEEDEEFVRQRVMKYCNIKELVVLKPLEKEHTRHVDMFATFLAPDLVLVAKIDPRLDRLNASILDYNAKVLSKVKMDGRPLRVERIWIPPRRGENWSPFTNIILTDRLVLIPTFDNDPPAYVQRAVKTYKSLLPEHHVVTIDMTSMEKLGGSLHCLSCPLPSFAEMPKGMVSFQQALARVRKSPVKSDVRSDQGKRKANTR